MSVSAGNEGTERQAFAKVEAGVGRLLEEMRGLRERTRSAEARVKDVEALLRRFTRGDEDPADLKRRADALEEANRELTERIREGREAVDRLLARIRFLEEHR